MLKTVGFPSTRTGDQTIVNGNLVIGTAGKGIDFSATPGTGTSELFNDYEEGTFTPTIFGSSTAGTATYAFQIGRYTKIGNTVFATLRLEWSGHTGTGSMLFGGLPFTSVNASLVFPVSFWNGNITVSPLSVLQPFVNPSANIGSFQEYPVGGGSNGPVGMDPDGFIGMNIQYETT